MSYDSILKFVVETYPHTFVKWLLNVETENVTLLQAELNVEPIRADGLFFMQVAETILHLEFQTLPKSTPPLPLRMLDYWVRLYRQYNCLIEQVVIFLKPTTTEAVFIDYFREQNTTHLYRIIRIWELESESLIKIPGLLPLAVLAKGESSERILQQVAEAINIIEDRREKSNVSACVQLLAGLKFDQNLINLYLSEELMQESVIYNSILEKGLQKGFQQGMQQGVQQGIQQGEVNLLLRQLKRRFPDLTEAVEERIKQLSIEQIEALSDAFFEFQETADLVQWLDRVFS
ncbi:hypothetical protein C7H19_20855 [Aphanothece hegewaldii CCALA 016]|uniref:DUF4351 domain-containing protein n=1 Tax=Aphanothece hegewaldii CCALA 016 TaxID=2107694 RepID=A0A2T1LSM0_9CHRO|nr:DUF4351 domain-containing protein [Aphanothece hegewaldii]PSF33051.1 hypothetical protein C7H19_20855 [Aphanothece hegewaldii CCALA 016]